MSSVGTGMLPGDPDVGVNLPTLRMLASIAERHDVVRDARDFIS
jgi:hypothetical protein